MNFVEAVLVNCLSAAAAVKIGIVRYVVARRQAYSQLRKTAAVCVVWVGSEDESLNGANPPGYLIILLSEAVHHLLISQRRKKTGRRRPIHFITSISMVYICLFGKETNRQQRQTGRRYHVQSSTATTISTATISTTGTISTAPPLLLLILRLLLPAKNKPSWSFTCERATEPGSVSRLRANKIN